MSNETAEILSNPSLQRRMIRMKKASKRKTAAIIIAAAVLLLAVSGVVWYVLAQHSTHEFLLRTADMSFDELLKEALTDRKGACITIGVLKDGQMSYEVYGPDAERLEQTEYRYEIGSITKTMTAALTARAIQEGKLQLTDTIDKYLELPESKVYPTIDALLTHTSGLNDTEYYEWSQGEAEPDALPTGRSHLLGIA